MTLEIILLDETNLLMDEAKQRNQITATKLILKINRPTKCMGWFKHRTVLRESTIATGVPVCIGEQSVMSVSCFCLSIFVCYVCMAVRGHISRTTRPVFTKSLYVLHVCVVRSSSGEDDVMFARNGREYAT